MSPGTQRRPPGNGATEETAGQDVATSVTPANPSNDRSLVRQALDAAIAEADGSKPPLKDSEPHRLGGGS